MNLPVAVHPHIDIIDRFRKVRSDSEQLIESLSVEDCALQAMPDVSPPKWHLAHTTWFFETFILLKANASYQAFNPQFQYLFNSYYNAIGKQYPRPQRHLLSRPSLQEVIQYRQQVTEAICDLLKRDPDAWIELVELGMNHEQQHQELLLMDIKYSFFQNPLYPAVQTETQWQPAPTTTPIKFVTFSGGLHSIGANGNAFHYDNETPVHQHYLNAYQLADRLTTNGEYLEFIQSGGYTTPEFWLSDAWAWINQNTIRKPLYWIQQDNQWFEFTLQGLKPLDLHRPVCHLSFFEADAYASWAKARLATEAEWEIAASSQLSEAGHFANQKNWHPTGVDTQTPLKQLFGEGWEWTASSYGPYPGYRAAEGAVGEYNGKFMCNQMVLRGGACVTPAGHIRPSYRNFFYPKDRWPFTALRLAKNGNETAS